MTEQSDNVQHPLEGSVVETLESLLLAFVLAMAFRSFVAEGFVIPTGSMAPTLMGRHFEFDPGSIEYSFGPESDWGGAVSGRTFRVDAGPVFEQTPSREHTLFDPILYRTGDEFGIQQQPDRGIGRLSGTKLRPLARMGDRILVLKCLYPFFMPKRYDVVVFKNPTEPDGEKENYIKRLIGLPNEKIWLVDGDVFVGPADTPDDWDDYGIERKPEHVQRAVWRPVYHSDYIPLDPRAHVPPWQTDADDQWTFRGVRAYRCETSDATILHWDNRLRRLDDWTAYNMFRAARMIQTFPVSDIRMAATIVPDRAGLTTTFRLLTRGHVFEFIVDTVDERVTVRMRAEDSTDWTTAEQAVSLPDAGEPINVQFWHVDQQLALYVDDERIVELPYDWKPMTRLEHAYGHPAEYVLDGERRSLIEKSNMPKTAELEWEFKGTPLTLRHVRVDRDLYYQPAVLLGRESDPKRKPAAEFEELLTPGTYGYGVHPDKPAVLGDKQYFMLGDNSPASLDGRVWGAPADLVKRIDPKPFVVNERLLLGKAWVVYFPAPYGLRQGGANFIPNFGRMRFIR